MNYCAVLLVLRSMETIVYLARLARFMGCGDLFLLTVCEPWGGMRAEPWKLLSGSLMWMRERSS